MIFFDFEDWLFVMVNDINNNGSTEVFIVNICIFPFALFPVHAGLLSCVKQSHKSSAYCHIFPEEINLKAVSRILALLKVSEQKRVSL